VRSVVRNGPAANSVRPPLPGDVLVKVDGYDVRGFSLTQLRSWLTGEEGSVVLLSFDGPGGRFDTSIVRAVNGSSSSSAHNGRSPPHEARRESTPDYESWRRDPLYNLVDSDAPQSPAYHDEHEHGMSSSPRRDDYESESWKGTGKSGAFPGPATSHGLARTSWAAEADKILAEAQAKIEDALHRERLLQETLDMLREKNEVRLSSEQGCEDACVGFAFYFDKLVTQGIRPVLDLTPLWMDRRKCVCRKTRGRGSKFNETGCKMNSRRSETASGSFTKPLQTVPRALFSRVAALAWFAQLRPLPADLQRSYEQVGG
jgi:hypothetical protein